MKIPIIPILLVVAVLLLPEAGRAQNSLVDRAARRYAAASWPEDSVFAGVVSNWIPVIPESLLENASVYTNREQTTSFTSTMLDWEMSPFVKKLDLRCFESPDFASSKRALLIELGGMQSTIPMSRGTNGLERLGDICYADLAQPSFVVFIRNNVFVSCFSSIDDNTLTNLLFFLDEQILASLETRGQPPEPDSKRESTTSPEEGKSVFANESDPPLSDRAEALRVHLGWTLPEQFTNVATALSVVPAGTNLLSGGVFAWQADRFGTRPDVLSLDLSMNGTNYSANLVVFQNERAAMVDLLENEVMNTLPLSFLLDRHVALPNPDHGFIIREFSAQGGNDDSTISRELHCLKGTIQVHLFTSVPGTNIVTVAHAIDDFIVGPEPD